MKFQTTSPDTSSIGFTDGIDGVIDMTVAANRARKTMLDVVRKGAREAFGEISRGVPKEYRGVLEGVKTLGRTAFDFITPSTERPTREQFIEESAMNLSPVPMAFAGVYTKRTLAAMKTLGENAEGYIINVSPDSRMFVSKNTKPEIVPKSIRSAVMSQGEIFPTAEGHERAIQLAKDYFGPNFIETDITKGWWGKTPRGKERFIALENSPDTDDPIRIAQAMSSGGRWRVTQLMKSNDEWVPLDHRTFSRKGLALKYATERGNKAEPFGVPPPGEITRSLARGDLEAGVAFRQVAGGGNRFVVQAMRKRISEDPRELGDMMATIDSITSHLQVMGEETSLIAQGKFLLSTYEKAGKDRSSMISFADDIDSFLRATRKAYPEFDTNPLIQDVKRLRSKRDVIDVIEREESSNAFQNIRASGRHVFAIRTERDREGPMAFGPSEWVNTRPQLNPEGVPETGWEYALRGSRGIEHRAGLPPGLRTPVGDLLEERHAIRAPTRETNVRSTQNLDEFGFDVNGFRAIRGFEDPIQGRLLGDDGFVYRRFLSGQWERREFDSGGPVDSRMRFIGMWNEVTPALRDLLEDSIRRLYGSSR